MSFTDNVLVDLLIVGIGTIAVLLIYKLISSIVKRTKRISQKRKLILTMP